MDIKEFKSGLLEGLIRSTLGISPDITLEDAGKRAKYDYKGFINAATEGDPRAASSVNPSDNRVHFPDPWKNEDHPTHLWKSLEDYGTQARYQPLTDEAYSNSFKAQRASSPEYQKMLELERTIPDYGVGGRDSQKYYTALLYELSRGK